MDPHLPEPTSPQSSPTEVFVAYLDYFRAAVTTKVSGLDDRALRTSRLPSGWSPLELVRHLTLVERRWLVWGFLGEPVGDPWADQVDGRWHVPAQTSVAQVLADFAAQAATSNAVLRGHPLSTVGAPGPRWDGAPPASLERIAFHLLQEYARHVGHLDVVRELLDGATGE